MEKHSGYQAERPENPRHPNINMPVSNFIGDNAESQNLVTETFRGNYLIKKDQTIDYDQDYSDNRKF